MRLLRQALFCLTIILGAAACAAPANGPQVNEPHSTNDHIPPPQFKDSAATTSDQRYCLSCDKTREYCHRDSEGICGITDAPGVCRLRPEACTMQYEPVCGCDGKTYGNWCVANSNGVNVSSKGECTP